MLLSLSPTKQFIQKYPHKVKRRAAAARCYRARPDGPSRGIVRSCISAPGIEPPTSLTSRLLDFFHLDTVEELLHHFTSRGQRHPRYVDRLTPLLLDESLAGDSVPTRIIREHGDMLGKYALAAARKVDIEGTAFTLVLTGGVFRHSSQLLEEAIVERIRTTSPAVRPARCRYEPIIGVLFTALEAASVAVDDTLLQRLVPTIPGHAFFKTTFDYSK
jgi:N-acetylglucosamine kinase-like BadF-type ATPase